MSKAIEMLDSILAQLDELIRQEAPGKVIPRISCAATELDTARYIIAEDEEARQD